MHMKSRKVCIYWKQGRCNRNPCRFVHGDLATADLRASYVYRAPRTQSQALPGGLRRKTLSPPEEDRAVKRSKSTQVTSAAVSQKSRNNCQKIESAQKPEASLLVTTTTVERSEDKACCQEWMSGSCGRGDSCQFLHSWSRGDGFSLLARLEGHVGKPVSGIGLPSGSDKLYTASSDGKVCAWDCHSGLISGAVNVSDQIGCLISDEEWVFVGFPNGVKAWNFKSEVYYDLTGPSGQVNALEVGLDALYAGAEDGGISVWKGFTDHQLANRFQHAIPLRGHASAVTCLRASINGELHRLYSGSTDGMIKEWDLNTGECIQTLKAHDDDVTSVICWDQYLVSCSLDKKVKFWGRTEEGGDEIILLYTHEEEHAALALGGVNDSDGKPILFCSWNDNSVGLYELPSLKERGRIYAEKEVRAIRAGQEGLFFTGDASGVVSVWKLAEKLVAS
ncbi:unnamed protein product [Linum tenue]|uniref:C3H1-type domain-containing protein n=3 Tax=Linum tenue TaxID=586396 RepID=A0AAV0NLS5_9ROSI|nr:unnamed protein product [Linum tenue]